MRRLLDKLRKLEAKYQDRVAARPYAFTTKDGSVEVKVWPDANGGRACVVFICSRDAQPEVLEEIMPHLPKKFALFAYPAPCNSAEEWMEQWSGLTNGGKVNSYLLLTHIWQMYNPSSPVAAEGNDNN